MEAVGLAHAAWSALRALKSGDETALRRSAKFFTSFGVLCAIDRSGVLKLFVPVNVDVLLTSPLSIPLSGVLRLVVSWSLCFPSWTTRNAIFDLAEPTLQRCDSTLRSTLRLALNLCLLCTHSIIKYLVKSHASTMVQLLSNASERHLSEMHTALSIWNRTIIRLAHIQALKLSAATEAASVPLLADAELMNVTMRTPIKPRGGAAMNLSDDEDLDEYDAYAEQRHRTESDMDRIRDASKQRSTLN